MLNFPNLQIVLLLNAVVYINKIVYKMNHNCVVKNIWGSQWAEGNSQHAATWTKPTTNINAMRCECDTHFISWIFHIGTWIRPLRETTRHQNGMHILPHQVLIITNSLIFPTSHPLCTLCISMNYVFIMLVHLVWFGLDRCYCPINSSDTQRKAFINWILYTRNTIHQYVHDY